MNNNENFEVELIFWTICCKVILRRINVSCKRMLCARTKVLLLAGVLAKYCYSLHFYISAKLPFETALTACQRSSLSYTIQWLNILYAIFQITCKSSDLFLRYVRTLPERISVSGFSSSHVASLVKVFTTMLYIFFL